MTRARSFRPQRPRPPGGRGAGPDAEALVREAVQARATRLQGYRARALELYGWICGRCAREFEASDLHLLTVHHRDGNHSYNPPDGSNWENLCVDCHEAEHTVEQLADYLSGRDRSS